MSRHVEPVVNRDGGIRFLDILVVGLLSLLMVGAYRLLIRADTLRAVGVTVSGVSHLERDEVLIQAGVAPGVNLLAVNAGLVRRRLEAHPWIRRAEVLPVPPRELRITVTEYLPIMVADLNGRHFLVSRDGIPFVETGEDDETEGLPRITGLRLSDLGITPEERRRTPLSGIPLDENLETPLSAYSTSFNAVMNVLQFVQRMRGATEGEPALARFVRRIHVDASIGVTLYLTPAPELCHLEVIRLGLFDYERKLSRLVQVLEAYVHDGGAPFLKAIDLTNPDQVVVTPARRRWKRPRELRRNAVQGQDDIVVGLDIGTTKICAVVGEISGDEVNIIGVGTHPSVGLRKGVVVNIESTVDSIKKAVEDAELMAGCEITSVYAGIAGGHITGFNSRGIIAIKGEGEISQQDVDRVVDAARAVAIPMDREVIHVIPQEYIVDDQPGILNPIGMSAVRLEAKIHIVTGAVTSAHNIVKCCNKAGLDVADIVLESLASSEAVLTEDERELGAALLDLGGGTTDLAIFSGKHIKHTFVLALGGNNITNDIAIGLRSPLGDAEKIKLQYGCCRASSIADDEIVEVPGVGGRGVRQMPRKIIGEILEPRMEEIFTLIQREIYRANMDHLINSGMVLTGGTSLLGGVTEVAESIFNVPTRLGRPRNISGLVDVVNNPMFATGVGLVLFGARNRRAGKKFRIRDANIFNRLMTRMKRWFKDII